MRRSTSAKKDENMIGKKCTVEEHRPCELSTGVAFAKDISEEFGVPLTPKLKKIIATGKGTEKQVCAAIAEWQYSFPSDKRKEADWLVSATCPASKQS